MIVDNDNNGLDDSTNHSFPKSKLLERIIESIHSTAIHFRKVTINKRESSFNENELTQFFIIQNQVQISNLGIPIYPGVEYRDTYHQTKGIPDIYYSILEEGVDYEPVFIMEAKRLPAPSANREKEYVIGKTPSGNPNGGMERFKLENHGKGLNYCGMLGYIERDSFEQWLEKINAWISELIPEWSEREKLELLTIQDTQAYIESTIVRPSSNLKLLHFWIYIK